MGVREIDAVQSSGMDVAGLFSSLAMLVLLLVFTGLGIALIIAIIRWLNRKDRK